MLARFMPDNPVLTKELRVRMRGGRAYVILFGYLGFLTALMLYQYYDWQTHVRAAGAGGSEIAALGADMFQYIVLAQMFLVLFITPAITSGAITIEREQQTLDMLTTTMLPFRSIIVGKLLSAVAFTTLLIISSLPLVSICFMLGSVDPAMVVGAYVEMLLGSLLIGAMGLAWSSAHKSTTPAVLSTYGTLFVLTLFCAFLFSMMMNPGAASGTPFQAVGQVWFGSRFFGVGGLDGLGFDLFCLLGAWLLSAMAMVRLELKPERRSRLLRILTLLVVGSQLFLCDIWWLKAWYLRGTGAVFAVVGAPLGSLMITIVAMMLIIPIFATGVLENSASRGFLKYWLRGWLPKSMSRGDMASGVAYLVFTSAISIGLLCVAFVLTGHKATVFTSTRLAISNAAVVVGDLPQAAIAIVLFVFGFAMLSQLIAIITRNRRVALLLSYLVLGLIVIVPEVQRSMARTPAEVGPFINLYYLNPLQSIIQMNDPVSYFIERRLVFGAAPMWQASALLWTAIGLASLIGAHVVAGGYARRGSNDATLQASAAEYTEPRRQSDSG